MSTIYIIQLSLGTKKSAVIHLSKVVFIYIFLQGNVKQLFLKLPSLKLPIKGQIRSTDKKYGMGLGTRRVEICETVEYNTHHYRSNSPIRIVNCSFYTPDT